MSQYTITVNSRTNLPPSQVGDGSSTIDYGETLVFTRNLLTSLLNPPYQDPEGDAASELLVESLPGNGVLEYNGNPVQINDIIPFTDIDNGLFVFRPDAGITTAITVNFDFQISDVGSSQFVG